MAAIVPAGSDMRRPNNALKALQVGIEPTTAALEAAARPSGFWSISASGSRGRTPERRPPATISDLGNAVTQRDVADRVTGRAVLLRGERPAEAVERPQHEPLRNNATVQRI